MDNLPPDLLKEAVTALDQRFGHAQPIAAVIDVRAGRISGKLLEVLGVGFPGRRVTVLFLEADDDVLIRRQDGASVPIRYRA
ncbi:MAG: RNase adapter RapZ [Nocardioidaceae bacterium]